MPPKDDPAAPIPIARALRRLNQCGTTATAGRKRVQSPSPQTIPWLKNIWYYTLLIEVMIRPNTCTSVPNIIIGLT